MRFKIKIDSGAREDIQNGIDWYDGKSPGLGRSFYSEIKIAFNILKSNPFFQIRYDDIRCLPLRRFPFLVHFMVNEKDKLVIVYAVLNTSSESKIWKNS